MTPAQASGHPNFVTDWPVQGPTDEGLRAADCHFARTNLPAHPGCVDCGGPIPMWTQQALSNVRGPSAGIGDRVSFGGGGVLGFALGAPGDPDVFGSLTADQQKWVIDTLVRLNDLITKSTGTSCPTFGPSVPAAAGCFQVWFNAAFAGQPVTKLRTDGVFDRDTLNALITTTQIHASDFPTPFPGDAGGVTSASLVGGGKKLSDGAKIAIGVGGALALGGILYATTRGGGRKSRKGRR